MTEAIADPIETELSEMAKLDELEATRRYTEIVDMALAQLGERNTVPVSEIMNLLLDGRNLLNSN